MPNPIASGLKTIIDLSDGLQLTLYLECNLSKIQIYDINAAPTSAYTPDWSSTNLIITPQFFVGSTAVDVSTGSITSLTWSYKRTGDINETIVVSGSGDMYINSTTGALTVSANKMSASGAYKHITFFISATYTDPHTGLTSAIRSDVSFSLVTTGTNAASLKLSGDQVIRYSNDAGTAIYAPSVVTLSANTINIVQSSLRWCYIDANGDEQAINNNGNTSCQLSPTGNTFINGVAKIKCSGSDVNTNIYFDVVSVHIISEAPSVFLSNENITFPANSNGQISGMTETCNVIAYMGANKVTPVISSISYSPSLPQGLTVTQTNVVNDEIVLTIAVAPLSTFNGDTGSIIIHVSDPVAIDLSIVWTKVRSGSIGENGIVFSLYCPDGLVFLNKSGTKTIKAQAYDGSTQVLDTDATFQWYKYDASVQGNWSAALATSANAHVVNGSTLTVYADEVPSEATYKCAMTYGGNTYTDIITLTDKTDNYQVVIDSTKGDVFKNSIGDTCLICNLWQNGEIVDGLKSTTISDVPPSNGTYFYFVDKNNKTVSLEKRYNGSWMRVADNSEDAHIYSYVWTKRTSSGDADGVFRRTGKVIYIDGDDVDSKSVFVCTVST